MHILFVTGEYPPQRGGVGAYTEQLALALAQEGARVSLLTSAAAHAAESRPHSVAVFPEITQWDWRIWRLVAERAQHVAADWIHVQYQTAAFAMHPAINFAPGRWRKSLPVQMRVAWTYHDLLVPYLFPKAGAHLRRWVTERPAASAQLVIVTNAADAATLAQRRPDAQTIPIGSNVTGQILSPEERAAVRHTNGYTNAAVVIGYFGFLNRSKGGLTLVRTLEALVTSGVDAHLRMVGERIGDSDPTNAAYLAEVEALIRALGLEDRVRWSGHLPDAEAAAELNALDVLLLPYEDGASLRRGTLMAGLANGCAIVTTMPRSPLPEIEDGRDLLYVPPGDAVAAARAVRRICGDAPFSARLRAHAHAAAQQFGWQTIARRHMALYAQAVRS